MSRRIIGLDIKEDAVSAVLLTSSMKGISVDYYQYHSLAEVEDNADIDDPCVAALKKITNEVDLKDTVCVAAFPAAHVSFRNLQVPFREPKRIKQILPLELEPAMPFPIDNAAIEFQVLDLPRTAGQAVVLTATLETDWLAEYKTKLKKAGIDPHIITVGGYHIARCLDRIPDPPEQYLMLDMEGAQSTLYAVHSGQVCLIRSFVLGTPASVETLICGHMHRTLAAAEEVLGVPLQPSLIFINGVEPADMDFYDAVSANMDVPAKPVDLTTDMTVTFIQPPEADWQPQRMNNALALALSDVFGLAGFNFGRRPFAAMQQWVAYKRNIVQTGVLACVVLLLGFGNVLLDYYTTSRQIAKLDKRIEAVYRSAFPNVTRIQDPLMEMRAKVKVLKEQSMLSNDSDKNIRAIDILSDVSKRIPESVDLELTQLVVGPDTVLISGNTATFNMVDDIKSNLEKSELFENVTISSANTERSGSRITFKLKIDL